MKAKIYKRALFISVLFIFSACTPICEPSWKTLSFDAPCFTSKRKTFPSLSSFDGLALEYAEYSFGDRFYINLESCLPLTYSGEVLFIFNEGEQTVEGDIFDGHQRIQLPQTINTAILTALRNNETFEIRIYRFRATITANKF